MGHRLTGSAYFPGRTGSSSGVPGGGSGGRHEREDHHVANDPAWRPGCRACSCPVGTRAAWRRSRRAGRRGASRSIEPLRIHGSQATSEKSRFLGRLGRSTCVTGTALLISSNRSCASWRPPGPARSAPNAMAWASGATSSMTSASAQSKLPLSGRLCMLSKASGVLPEPSTRIHRPAEASIPSPLTAAENRTRLPRYSSAVIVCMIVPKPEVRLVTDRR